MTEPETLEAVAIREGIYFALDLNLSKIKVATDFLMVAKALRKRTLEIISTSFKK
jgi:hypothetical protein